MAPAVSPLVRAQGVVFDYAGPIRALDHLNAEFAAGELCVLLGPNGSGKSTLLKLCAGLIAPQAGDLLLDGVPLRSSSARERARRVALVPQFLPALPEVSVADFVLGGRYARLLRWNRVQPVDRASVEAALRRCDALELAGRSMAELSGGQRQRVLVARALAQDTELLLVDEPTNALDPEHQVRVFDLVAEAAAAGRCVVVATHDLNLASQYATRLLLLEQGRVVATGSVAEILRREVLEPVYGARLAFGEALAGGARWPFVLPRRNQGSAKT